MSTEIIAIISVILSVTVPSYLVYRQKNIEAQQRHSEESNNQTVQLVTQLQAEVARLRNDLARRDEESTVNYLMIQDLRREVSEFRWGVMKLIRQIHDLGEKPVWEPKPDSEED